MFVCLLYQYEYVIPYFHFTLFQFHCSSLQVKIVQCTSNSFPFVCCLIVIMSDVGIIPVCPRSQHTVNIKGIWLFGFNLELLGLVSVGCNRSNPIRIMYFRFRFHSLKCDNAKFCYLYDNISLLTCCWLMRLIIDSYQIAT